MQISEVPVSKAAVIVLGSKVPEVKMVSSAAKRFNKPTRREWCSPLYSKVEDAEEMWKKDTVGMLWYDVCNIV